MKTLGRTEEGNAIVEMSQDEYREFIILESSLVDRYVGFGDYRSTLKGVDLSPVFKALSDLATAKHSITTLQSYINNLANYFGKVQLPKKEIDA